MAPRHSLCKLLVSGSALLVLGLLLQPCPAQTSKSPKKPVAKEAARKEAKTPAPLQIAVVDMDKARTAHPHFKARLAEHKAWAQKQELELDKLQKDIQSKQAQLQNTVQPGSAAARKLALEIETQRFKLGAWSKQLRSQSLARHNRLLLDLQTQVRGAIKELASRRGIHLVLWRRSQTAPGGLRGQVQRAESTDVLYAAASLDITEDVIDFLKTKYPPK